MINVQFTDATCTAVSAYFASPQDPTGYPNQGQIELSDARWAAFYTQVNGAFIDLPAPTSA